MSIAALTGTFFGLFNYWIVIVLMMIGFYIVISHDNLVKKLIGLNVFQTAVFIFYISMGKIAGSTAPILTDGDPVYAHPLPHVLILTAIVVGVSTLALGLALVVRIHEAYGSIEEDDVLAADFELQAREQTCKAERDESAHTHTPPDSESAARNDSPEDNDAHGAPEDKESTRS